MKITFASILVIFLFTNGLSAQRCNCQHFIRRSADGAGYINGLNTTIKPGDTVCISSGTYKSLRIININGNAEHPVVFINCGAAVVVGSGTYAISIEDCSYFRFTGTGDTSIYFGIKVYNPVSTIYDNVGVGIAGNSSNLEIDHLEISKMQTGVMMKNDPDCRPSTWEEAHTFNNISFHDLYLHRIVDMGFLLGYPGDQVSIWCNNIKQTVNPQKIVGLRIFNCRIDSIGGVGIQVSDAPMGVEIFNNSVKNYGLRSRLWYRAGIILGGLVNGVCYNNLIKDGSGSGLQILGTGKILAYNNILDHTASDDEDAIYVDDRPSVEYKPLHVYLVNNTIIGAARNAIRIQNMKKTMSSDNLICNNLILDCKTPYYFGAGHRMSHNLVHQDPKWARLDDQYSPKEGSPVIHAGEDVASYGISVDFNGNDRGKTTDVGAVQMIGKSENSLHTNLQ